MLENLNTLQDWASQGETFTMATVISTWGSAPRPIGSNMFVSASGKMVGSVSGGCVEGAVVKKSIDLIKQNEAERISFGVSDEDAWSVGLSCGGKIQVYLQEVDFKNSLWRTLKSNLETNKPSILVYTIDEHKRSVSLINEDDTVIGNELSKELFTKAKTCYQQRIHNVIEHEGREYFIQLFPRKNTLLVIGAAHITVDLVDLGNQFGFDTIVIDPRKFFAENTVFSNPPRKVYEQYPSEVLGDIPLDAFTYCATLSHDPKIDDNALQILLKKDLGYIGALGSRKTHAKRTARLLEHGFTQEEIDKIKAPIGLSIKAKSAKEIALAVFAQIIEAKNQYL